MRIVHAYVIVCDIFSFYRLTFCSKSLSTHIDCYRVKPLEKWKEGEALQEKSDNCNGESGKKVAICLKNMLFVFLCNEFYFSENWLALSFEGIYGIILPKEKLW